jgi:mannose-1-phosphate guanylyltransferase/mannose-1-phosphate guanylyltransferase/mannose-6-phosphate isomerase
MFDHCLILAGGSGTRLWPASSSAKPKQFLAIPEGGSFFDAALKRALALSTDSAGVIIIAGASHVAGVLETCASYSEDDRARMVLIPEPEAKNTAPAVACALAYMDALSPRKSRTALTLTSDHIIEPLSAFAANARTAAEAAASGRLVVFGIRPSRPETGYGYIEVTAPPQAGQAAEVRSFHEKPDPQAAERYVAAGNFLWNSGMFAFSTPFMREAFIKNAPELYAYFDRLPPPEEAAYTVRRGLRVLDTWPGLADAYAQARSVSFDYAIAEKCGHTVAVEAGFNWFDVGSWDEYARLSGTHNAGAVYLSGTDNTFVDADMPVALCGVDDLIVVARSGKDGSPPAVLVVKKGESQRVRDIVAQIREAGRTELL